MSQMQSVGNKGDDEKWRAVASRDPRQDGRFVYAVRTTGVFCRPGCPSRRPLRANVSFFAGADSARSAGFRPCKRCRPERGPGEAPEGVRQKVLLACRHIESAVDRVPTLAELGEHVSLSPSHLQRVFKRTIGLSPRAYAETHRLERLKRGLREGEDIAGAAFGAGFGSSSRLYEGATEKLGMTPRTYRERAAGQTIRVLTLPCRLGVLSLAATERGVCAARLGDSAKALRAELEGEFAAATLVDGDAALRESAEAIVAALDADGTFPDLPRDVQATAFQRRVWDAIRAIPPGRRASYSELAKAIGRPKAVRAVASACARNPTALLVPCHRVVPKGGGTGQYRWGVERKKKLLSLEERDG